MPVDKHNEWDYFAPMYLRAHANEAAADMKPDLSWYNDRDKEFTITTAGQLRGLAYIVNNCSSVSEALAVTDGKTFKLGANIDLNPYWDENDGSAPCYLWLPIGIFSGTLDGQGYTIRGIICKPFYNIPAMTGKTVDGWGRDMALIGRTYGDVTVKDLIITNSSVESDLNAAALIAYVKEGTKAVVTIDNVYVDADAATYGTSNTTGIYGAGILIGIGATKWDGDGLYNEGDIWAVISNCALTGSLTINGNGGSFGVGPVWSYADRGVNNDGKRFDATATISNVVVFDMNMTAYKNGKYESYRIKDIANCGSWTETDSVRVLSDGALKNTSGTVNAYPDGWIRPDDSNSLCMPTKVAELISRNLWIQETEVNRETGTFDIRILTVIDTLDWDQIGIVVEMKIGNSGYIDISEDIPTVDRVYSSLVAAGAHIEATELGGKYISAVVLSGIPAALDITFRMTPIKYIGDTVYENAHASIVTYVNGVLR